MEHKLSTIVVFFLLLQLMVLPLYIIVLRLTTRIGIFPLILNYILAAIGVLALAFIVIPFNHLFVLLFGGRAGIKKTFQAFLYGMTPVILISWLPFAFLLVSIYSMYLIICGLRTLHEMTTRRAVLAFFLPLSIAFVFNIITILVILRAR